MKKLFFIISLLTYLPWQAYGQKLDCQKFKTGTYKIFSTNSKTVIIIRKDSIQIEKFEGSKEVSTYKLEWTDSCTYFLKPSKETFEKNKQLPANAILKVEITETTSSSYSQTVTSNFNDKKLTSEVFKVK